MGRRLSTSGCGSSSLDFRNHTEKHHAIAGIAPCIALKRNGADCSDVPDRSIQWFPLGIDLCAASPNRPFLIWHFHFRRENRFSFIRGRCRRLRAVSRPSCEEAVRSFEMSLLLNFENVFLNSFSSAVHAAVFAIYHQSIQRLNLGLSE
jgi:hypothetical protein